MANLAGNSSTASILTIIVGAGLLISLRKFVKLILIGLNEAAAIFAVLTLLNAWLLIIICTQSKIWMKIFRVFLSIAMFLMVLLSGWMITSFYGWCGTHIHISVDTLGVHRREDSEREAISELLSLMAVAFVLYSSVVLLVGKYLTLIEAEESGVSRIDHPHGPANINPLPSQPPPLYPVQPSQFR